MDTVTSREKRLLILVGALALVVVVLVIALFHNHSRNGRPSPEASGGGTSPIGIQDTSGSLPVAAANPPDNAFFDPDQAGASSELRLPVELNTSQIQDLCQKLDALTQLVAIEQSLVGEYGQAMSNACSTNVRDVIFSRVSGRSGFKNRDLPQQWSMLAKSTLPTSVWNEGVYHYIALRVNTVKNHVLAGQAVQGDIKFVPLAMQHVIADTKLLLPLVSSARKLQLTLMDEGILADADVGAQVPAPVRALAEELPSAEEIEANTASGKVSGNLVDGVVQTSHGYELVDAKVQGELSTAIDHMILADNEATHPGDSFRLGVLQKTTRSYELRCKAFQKLLPYVSHEAAAGNLTDKSLEKDIHALADNPLRPAIPPCFLGFVPDSSLSTPESKWVWDKRYLKVLAGLRESKERAFRGSAMVRDKERAAAAERWITQCEASYEDEHKKLDDMVGRVLKSGNPFLVKAVSGRKGDTYFGGRLIEAYVAVFSRDPTEVFYGADKVPYPVANPDDGVPTFPYPFDDVPNPLR